VAAADSAAKPLPAAVLSSFVVESELEPLVNFGKKVGPGEYQMWANSKSAKVGYVWSARMSDGTESDGQDCALTAKISGPVSIPSQLYSDCTHSSVNGFSDYGNVIDFTTPGVYQVTITDRLTGATGTTQITILGY